MLLPCLHPELIEAGCDEAGRGCLAGDVYAAAVILPPDYTHPLLNDSKQLTERQRYALREDVERDALAWALGIVTAKEIDEINILNASILAMHRALDALTLRPQYIVVEGNTIRLTIDRVNYEVTQREPRWNIPIKHTKHYTPVTEGAFTLYLSDEMVDFSQKVTLIVNGKQVYRGKVRSDMKHLVNSCATFFDPELLYAAGIEVEL